MQQSSPIKTTETDRNKWKEDASDIMSKGIFCDTSPDNGHNAAD